MTPGMKDICLLVEFHPPGVSLILHHGLTPPSSKNRRTDFTAPRSLSFCGWGSRGFRLAISQLSFEGSIKDGWQQGVKFGDRIGLNTAQIFHRAEEYFAFFCGSISSIGSSIERNCSGRVRSRLAPTVTKIGEEVKPNLRIMTPRTVPLES